MSLKGAIFVPFKMASSSSLSDTGNPDEESIITYYFSRGYTYEVITEFLATFHGIMMCGQCQQDVS